MRAPMGMAAGGIVRPQSRRNQISTWLPPGLALPADAARAVGTWMACAATGGDQSLLKKTNETRTDRRFTHCGFIPILFLRVVFQSPGSAGTKTREPGRKRHGPRALVIRLRVLPPQAVRTASPFRCDPRRGRRSPRTKRSSPAPGQKAEPRCWFPAPPARRSTGPWPAGPW